MKLGILKFEDKQGMQRMSYLYYAASFSALMSYAQFLQGLTTADINDIQWSDDGFVRWESGAYVITWHNPPLAYPGQLTGADLPGYNLQYIAAVRQKNRQRCAIPAPIAEIFDAGLFLRNEIGLAVTSAYAALTDRALVYSSGALVYSP